MKRIFHFMMDVRLYRLALLLFFMNVALLRLCSQTCDSLQCGCDKGNFHPSGIMIGHSHPKGAWMLSYRYMNMQMTDVLSGSSSLGSDVVFKSYIMSPQSMSMNMHMLMAMYGISSRLSVMVMLNYSTLSMNMNMLPGTMSTHMRGMTMADNSSTSMSYKSNGFSDVRLYAQYALVENNRHLLVASAGLSVPTGNIAVKGGSESMLPGQRLPYMMQLGSGTWDLLPGITYVLSSTQLSWGNQVSALIRPGYNRLGYACGNEATATSWLAYRFLPWLSASLRAEAGIAGSIRGRDSELFEIMEPGAAAKNYGGTKASAFLGLNIYLKRLASSKIALEYGAPFYQHSNGIQLAAKAAFYAGWTLSF